MTSRKSMEIHEAQCFHNPAKRACITCGNFGEESETVYDRHHGGDPGSSDYDIKIPYCEAGMELYDREKGAKLKHDCEKWREAKLMGAHDVQ